MRRGQSGGRRRQYLRGKKQLPRSHHSAAGCVNNVHVWICVSGKKLGNRVSRRFRDGGRSGSLSCLHGTLLPDNESVENFLTAWVDRPVPELHPSQQVTVHVRELDTRVSACPIPMPNAPVWE